MTRDRVIRNSVEYLIVHESAIYVHSSRRFSYIDLKQNPGIDSRIDRIGIRIEIVWMTLFLISLFYIIKLLLEKLFVLNSSNLYLFHFYWLHTIIY